MAALQPHRGAAGGLRRPGPGLVVPVHDPGADDTRYLSPLSAAADRGRAVDGGLRRVLGGHGQVAASCCAGTCDVRSYRGSSGAQNATAIADSTQRRPPLTTANGGDASAATAPARTCPRFGPPITKRPFIAVSLPR